MCLIQNYFHSRRAFCILINIEPHFFVVYGGRGIYICANTQFGLTPLIWAALKGHADCVRVLVEAGADMDGKDNVRSV